MKYTNNAIFTAIRAAVLAEVSTANCTQTYSPTPAKFPTVFAREIGRFTPAQTATVSNAQDIYETTWEVQVFSNLQSGAKEQAYRLMDAVNVEISGDDEAKMYADNFEFVVNGVTIYGCRVIEGKNGDFISFPAYKGSDGKYYSHVWIKLSDDDTTAIVEQVENML